MRGGRIVKDSVIKGLCLVGEGKIEVKNQVRVMLKGEVQVILWPKFMTKTLFSGEHRVKDSIINDR